MVEDHCRFVFAEPVSLEPIHKMYFGVPAFPVLFDLSQIQNFHQLFGSGHDHTNKL